MDTRARLLDKAEQLFSEHGYEGTSIRQLAGEAGVNVSMISYYFGSKEKLFEALVEERTAAVRERLKDLNEQSDNPVTRLEEMIRIYVDRFTSQPRFHRLLFHEVSINRRPELHTAIASVLMRNVEQLRRILTDGIRSGAFREVDVDFTIVTLVGTVNQLVTASPQMHQHMLGSTSGISTPESTTFRDRLYHHLHQLMMAHLLK